MQELDSEAQMEEQETAGAESQESLEGKAPDLHVVQIGATGELLEGAVPPQQFKQEPEDQCWENQLQDFLKTMQPSRSGWRNPRSPHYMLGEDSKYCPTSFKRAEEENQWPKVECVSETTLGDSKPYGSSQDSPVKVSGTLEQGFNSPKSDHSSPHVLKVQLPLEKKQEDDWEATLSGKLA
ncbi:hypothetical protein Chor_011632 [Crotalus horridus]